MSDQIPTDAVIAEFADGATLPAFNSALSEIENQRLSRAVATEARRRKKAGLPFHGWLREASAQERAAFAGMRQNGGAV